MTDPLPLAGVTVVSMEQAVAAPLASRHLADLGARVVKMERVGEGDFARGYDAAVRGLASHFVWLNRGKESIAVDLTDPGGLAVARRLVGAAGSSAPPTSSSRTSRRGSPSVSGSVPTNCAVANRIWWWST